MASHRLALLPGDGVGPEVTTAARQVIDALDTGIEVFETGVGWEYWKAEGSALPKRTRDVLKVTTCALLGPVIAKPREEANEALSPLLQEMNLVFVSPVVQLTQDFDLNVVVNRCKAYPGNPVNMAEHVDLTIVQEASEGFHAGIEFFPLPAKLFEFLQGRHRKMQHFEEQNPADMAISTRIVTREASARFLRHAFAFADRHGKRKVDIVDKTATFRETSRLILQEARNVASEYPGVEWQSVSIDKACMRLLSHPHQYEVVAAPDLFGDILGDLATQMVGGLGMVGRARIGEKYAVFEPAHGPATKYAGQDKMNPIATLQAVVLMLDWLGLHPAASRLDNAIARTIEAGHVRTFDMKGTATTSAMTRAILDNLE